MDLFKLYIRHFLPFKTYSAAHKCVRHYNVNFFILFPGLCFVLLLHAPKLYLIFTIHIFNRIIFQIKLLHLHINDLQHKHTLEKI